MIWIYRDGEWIFRIRRMVQNDLEVFKIPMSHSVPLQYEFLNLRNICPEALQIGEMCVIRQLEVLLKEDEASLCRAFDKIFSSFAPHPPYNGQDWREVGITSEMIIAFAEFRGIKLCVFHGNRKVKHLDGGSDQCLTYFCLGQSLLLCTYFKWVFYKAPLR